MTLSELAIRRHVFSWMLMAALIFFGALAYQKMGISLNPDVEFPIVNIGVTYEGASVEVIEKSVIDPLEETLVSIQGIRHIDSTALVGQANISVEFEINQDIDVAVQEIQSQILRANRNLPDDIDPPVVTKSNPEDRPIIYLVVRAPQFSYRDLMILVKEQIQDSFINIEGVSEISLFGYVEPTLRVDLDQDKLAYYELSPKDIIDAIKQGHRELPAGWIETEDQEQSIRVMGEIKTAEELKKIIIKNRGNRASFKPIRLEEVAHVYAGLEELRRISRTNGERTLALGIRKQRGANSVSVVDAIKSRITQVQKTLPQGVFLEINFDTTQFIREAVAELIFTLILSAILTALVCWIFLGSLSATFNVILAIPTSVIGSFIVLYLLGFTLNTFTLLGLSLAIGIVVDDAIIMVENIFRYLEKGNQRRQAALLGSKEITFAIIATTAAIVAIFLPIAFMKGIIGQYFFQFGVTISVAVVISSLEALTLAPMRLSQFGKRVLNKPRLTHLLDGLLNKLKKFYEYVLSFSFHHRFLVVSAAFVLFLSSLFFFFLLKIEFAPAQEENYAFIILRTAEGSSLKFTDHKVRQVEDYVNELPWIDRHYVSIGGFGLGGKTNSAIMIVFYSPANQRARHPKTGQAYNLSQMEQDLRSINQIKGVRAIVQITQSRSLGTGGGFPVEFTLSGFQDEKLRQAARDFIIELKKTKTMIGINSENIETKTELLLKPDRNQAQRYGVDIENISETLQILYGGVKPRKYSSGGRRYNILVKLPESERQSLRALQNIKIRNNRGELVNLNQVVTQEKSRAPLSIYRKNRHQSILISANIAPQSSQNEALQALTRTAVEKLPAGMALNFAGSSETFYESFESLIIVMILGIIVAYMVLASQFNSFFDPLVILTALPFSFSGALAALYLGGQSINVYSMIGLILLMGIAKKNSIMLVEFANQLRDRGMAKREATLQAASLRLRPILMTSIATITAAIPPALNFGPGAEVRIPMALAVLGGVFVSTLLTLVVVPTLYEWFSPLRQVEREKDFT